MNNLDPAIDRFGVTLDSESVALLVRYRELLLDANRRINLTGLNSPADVDARLIGESLALLSLIPSESHTLLDVGSGGGIPGLPLAITRPDVTVTLLDATAKKVRFLEETATELGLRNVRTVWGRAEQLAHDPEHREYYGVVTARAVARLATLVEYTLPFACIGGVVLLPKGTTLAEELAEAQFALTTLGGQARADRSELVVVINKRTPTPIAYPRRTGQPAKAPLLRPRSTP